MKQFKALSVAAAMSAAAFAIAAPAANADIISYTASSAISDPTLASSNNDHSIWLPFFRTVSGTPLSGNANSADFDFVWNGSFTIGHDGYATLTGQIASQVDMSYGFDVAFKFRTLEGPGAKGPKRELLSSAYVENGGPIDTNSFSFFELEGGAFTGTGALDGLNFGVTNRPGNAPYPLQFGEGANGKNGNLGASVWFSLFTDQGCDHALCSSLAGVVLNGDVNIDVQAVPVPAAFLLFGTGLAGLSAVRRKKSQK